MHDPIIQNKKFVVDVWVKGDATLQVIQRNDIADLSFQSFTPDTDSPEIEGWKRIYKTFDLVEIATVLDIVFLNNNGGGNAYVDDFRIYPFDANMKSFVYDPISLRLMAELDENNYATFYEYDEDGKLIRVKKEPKKGAFYEVLMICL